MENKDFEKIIREKLSGIEPEFDAEHWEMLEQRMGIDAVPEGGVREGDPLDELIGDKLRNLEVAFSSSHWAMLDQQLDSELVTEPEMEDVYLDSMAYENLNNLYTPYNPAHWSIMTRRIDELYSLRHNVHKYKLIEIGLFLFLIFTILPYLSISPTVQQQPQIAELPQDLERTATAASEGFASNEESSISAKSLSDSSLPGNSPNNPANELLQNGTGGTIQSPPIIIADPSAGEQAQQGLQIPALTNPHQNTSVLKSGQNLFDIALFERGTIPPFDPIAMLNPDGLDKTMLMPLGGFLLIKPKSTHIRLGMMAAYDINYIMTPYNQQFSFPAYDRFFSGYGGGLSLGIGMEKWELEVGALYSSISYIPEFNVEINGTISGGYSGEGLKAATLEVVKIPVNVHRRLGKIGKMQTSMLFGASMNTALFTNYEFKKVTVGTGPGSGPPPTSGFSSRPKNYDGFLQGGSLLENSYFTANLGFRIERDLSARWSVFVQPVYQHQLFSKTFGPNDDRINSSSLLFGIRANLRR